MQSKELLTYHKAWGVSKAYKWCNLSVESWLQERDTQTTSNTDTPYEPVHFCSSFVCVINMTLWRTHSSFLKLYQHLTQEEDMN